MMIRTNFKQPSPGPPAKSFFCVFCKDIVSLAVGNLPQFRHHMENIHRVFYEFDILLALNFIDRTEKEKIIDTVKNKVDGKNDTNPVIIKSNMSKSENKPITLKNLTKIIPAGENLLKEDADNVQMVVLDGNTTLEEAVKNLSAAPKVTKTVQIKPKVNVIKTMEIKPNYTKIKIEPNIVPKKPKVWSMSIKSEIHPAITIKQEKIAIGEANADTYREAKTYKCDKCAKIFPFKANLESHLSRKFSCVKPVLRCEKCSKKFQDKSSYQAHMARTKSCTKPKCEKCGKVFDGRFSYRQHMKRKKSCVKPKFACEKCNKQFNKKSNFDAHISRTKSCVRPNLKCEDCLKVFSCLSSFKSHQGNKEKACRKRVACEKCGKLIKEEKYKFHLNRKRGCVQINLKCDGCLKTFRTRAAARSHQKRQDKVCKRRIECEKCGERFKEELYKKHILRSCVKLECEKCGEKFTEGKLKLHQLRKRSCVVEEPKCNDCGKTFAVQASAKKHMQDNQGQCNMKFGCDNCGNTFVGIFALKIHQRMNKHCQQLQTIQEDPLSQEVEEDPLSQQT